jgi:hypothetical protein
MKLFNLVTFFSLFSVSLNIYSQTNEVKFEKEYLFDKHKYTEDFILLTKAEILSQVFPVTITQNQSELTLERNKNDLYDHSSNYSSEIISTVNGVWVKDITPPEITYSKKGKEKWITVKVHGYVAKRPNKTEARELLLKQLSAKPLMEDVQVHSIEYYPNDFVISIVVLDSTNYKSHSEMHRVANILAKRQVLTYFSGSKIEDVFIYKTTSDGKFEISKDVDSQNTYSAVKESSSGWVNAIESLDKIKIKGTNEWAFIFLKEIENL